MFRRNADQKGRSCLPKTSTISKVLALIVAAGVAASAATLLLVGHYQPDISSYELAVSLTSVQRQARLRGLVPEVTLERLAAAGVTAAVIEERTLFDLDEMGDLIILRGDDALQAEERLPDLAAWRSGAPGVPVTLLLTAEESLAQWALDRAQTRFGEGRSTLFASTDGFWAVAIRGSLPPYTRLGLYPPDIAAVREVGLRLIVELQNPREEPDLALAQALEPLLQTGSVVVGGPATLPADVEAVIFDGEAVVVGGPATLPADVEAVIFDGEEVWWYGIPGGPAQAGGELAALDVSLAVDPLNPPAGLHEFGAAARWHAMKVQTVWSTGRPELFAEGVIERASPLLIIMPGLWQRFGDDPAWPGAMVSAIEVFTAGRQPEPMSTAVPPVGLSLLVAWGLLAGVALAGLRLSGASIRTSVGVSGEGASARVVSRPRPALKAFLVLVLFAGLVVSWLIAAGDRALAARFLTLAGSIAFPVIALYPTFRVWASPNGGSGAPSLYAALREAVRVAALTATGGLLVLAAGTGPQFLLKTVQMPGTKLSLAAGPALALVLLWMVSREGRPPSTNELREWVERAVRRPVTLGLLASVLAILAVAFFYINRSGNFPVIPVSDMELEFRSRLADIFAVRPRTKECGYMARSWGRPAASRILGRGGPGRPGRHRCVIGPQYFRSSAHPRSGLSSPHRCRPDPGVTGGPDRRGGSCGHPPRSRHSEVSSHGCYVDVGRHPRRRPGAGGRHRPGLGRLGADRPEAGGADL